MIQIHQGGPKRPHAHVLDDFGGQSAQMVADAVLAAIRHRGRCRLGLAGGNTPAALYGGLREVLPADAYRQLLVTWTDERVLEKVGQKPGDWQQFDPESHLRQAYSGWLGHVELPHENVLPLALSGDAKAELLRFGQAFRDQFAGGLDIALVTLGADGQLGSLHAGHPALDVEDIALAIHDSPKPPAARIAISLPVLKQAGTLIVLARGAAKAKVVLQALQGAPDQPLARLLDHPRAYVLLDAAAATELVSATMASMTKGD